MYHPQKRDRTCSNCVATSGSVPAGGMQAWADSCNLNGAWVENQLISRRVLTISIPFAPTGGTKHTDTVRRCKYPVYTYIQFVPKVSSFHKISPFPSHVMIRFDN